MPTSRVRKKDAKPQGSELETPKPVRVDNPKWLIPLMISLFVIGLAWLVVYYATSGSYPLPVNPNWWNMVAGFGFIIAGFITATFWR